MKYNDELFNISRECVTRLETTNFSRSENKIEERILNILLDRYKKNLKIKDKKLDGILKVRIRSVDDGYLEIEELINSGRFTSFGSDYCIYVSKIHNGAYIDLIWDYKTYFDILNSFNHENLEYDEKNNIELMCSICEFKKLPISHQLSVIKSFTRKVKKQKLLLEKEIIDGICKKEGHSFSDWEKEMITVMERNPYLGSRDYIVPEGKEWLPKTYPQWSRKCSRCGFVEGTIIEPEEVRKKREEEEKQLKIEKLERELKSLRGK